MFHHRRSRRFRRSTLLVSALVSFGLLTIQSSGAQAASSTTKPGKSSKAAQVGKVCKKAGQKSGSLVCTKRLGRLVWSKLPASAAPVTPPDNAPTTKPGAAVPAGIEGSWVPSTGTTVGYRVKEVLGGQDTEGVGRTTAVTGSMKIAGTTVSSVELTADLTKLESDSGRRDEQVQGRILETAKFPTASIKLKTPIDLGSVPADKIEITKPATITLTLHGVSKDIEVSIKARRNGSNIEVNGAIQLVFADFGITNPSLPPFVTTDPNGLLEFLVVFAR
jgi:polyisoprenoid-binding protein YceI